MRTAIQTHIETGAPLRQLERNLEPLFGKTRAQVIASTETTRMFAEGNKLAYKSAGVEEVEFQTVKDAAVDPDCEALQGKKFPIDSAPTPPIHPRCRCWLAPITDEGEVLKQPVDVEAPEPFISDIDDLAIRRGSYGDILRKAKESNAILKARWGKNPEFMKLAKASQRFGSASTPIREASRAAMQGRVADVAQAAKDAASILTKNLRTAPVQEKSLWRGMQFGPRTSMDDLKAAWQVGSTTDIPISSTSYARDVAKYFANGRKKIPMKGKHVMLEFQDTQGLPITAFSKHAPELESLIGGRFEVISAVGRGDNLNVVLKQVASL